MKEHLNSTKNSNIELLRMFCMFIIILHHSVLYGGGTEQAFGLNKIFSTIFYIGGKLGADCFMAISAYYMIDSKFKIKRIVNTWISVYFYQILFILLNIIFHFTTVGLKEVIELFFPVSYDAYWFATAYIGVVAVSPFLNALIRQLNIKSYHLLLVILSGMVMVPATFLPGANTFLDKSHLILFILIYLIIGYYKKGYIRETISYRTVFLSSMSILIILGIGILLIGHVTEISAIENYSTYFYSGESFPMVIAAVSLALWILGVQSKSNVIVNFISPGCFDVYLIHMNHLFYLWLWNELVEVEKLLVRPDYPIVIVGWGLAIFCISLFIGNLRVIATRKLINKLCDISFLRKGENFINQYFGFTSRLTR